MGRTLVSVVIPTYDRRAYVLEAIRSAAEQRVGTLAHLETEIILIDDGSTDGTREAVLEEFGHLLRYIETSHSGANAARNLGVQLARGDLVAFLDSDDRWLPEKLELQVQALRDSDADAVYSGFYVIDDQGHRIGVHLPQHDDSALREAIRHGNVIGTFSTACVRKGALEAVGGLDPELPSGQDYDMWLRLLGAGFKVVSIRQPLAEYRVHAGHERISNQPMRALYSRRRMLSRWGAYGLGPVGARLLQQVAELELKYGDFGYGRRLLFNMLKEGSSSRDAWLKALLSLFGSRVYRGGLTLHNRLRGSLGYRPGRPVR